jgi:hypothetical protein
MIVRIALLVMWALTSVGVSQSLAQKFAPSGCGSLPNAQGYLAGFGRYFRDDDMADVRGDEIVQLSPNASQEIVTRVGTCQAVRQAALRMLRQYEPSWPRIEAAGYDFVVLRYGDYYAILVKYEVDPDTGRRPDYIPLLVFRTQGFSYVTTILV